MMQAKDIPDDVFLAAVEAVQRQNAKEQGLPFRLSTGRYDGQPWAMRWDVAERLNNLMGFDVPEKVVLAKFRALYRRKMVDGCTCGCRGDWQLRATDQEGEAMSDGRTGTDRMSPSLPEADVPGEGFLSWASQATQYPKVGPPGISLETHMVEVGVSRTLAIDPRDGELKPARVRVSAEVHCLLFRNRKGALVGILNHYPVDCYDIDGNLLERAGSANLWVRPNRRGRGIGRRLLSEALDRWAIDPTAQRYTVAGRGLMASVLAERLHAETES